MDDKIHSEPSEARPIDGVVSVEGPDGVSVLLTPDAAAETSDRLLDAAVTARGQRLQERPGRDLNAVRLPPVGKTNGDNSGGSYAANMDGNCKSLTP